MVPSKIGKMTSRCRCTLQLNYIGGDVSCFSFTFLPNWLLGCLDSGFAYYVLRLLSILWLYYISENCIRRHQATFTTANGLLSYWEVRCSSGESHHPRWLRLWDCVHVSPVKSKNEFIVIDLCALMIFSDFALPRLFHCTRECLSFVLSWTSYNWWLFLLNTEQGHVTKNVSLQYAIWLWWMITHYELWSKHIRKLDYCMILFVLRSQPLCRTKLNHLASSAEMCPLAYVTAAAFLEGTWCNHGGYKMSLKSLISLMAADLFLLTSLASMLHWDVKPVFEKQSNLLHCE